jgi:hypothetical protein
MKEYGTDALRFSLIQNIAPGNDIRYIPEKVEAGRNFANKLWNASRFSLTYIEEMPSAKIDEAKLYPEDKVEDPYYKPQKITLGFEKGFITLVKGKVDKYWAVAVGARATRLWGWYIPSDTELPELPQGLSFQKLSWEEISTLAESGLIEFANHTYALHFNDGGRKGADKLASETQSAYAKVLSDDLLLNQEKIESYASQRPLAFVWPYGAYPMDGSADEILKNLGFKISLTSYQINNTIRQGDPNSLLGLKRFLRTPDFDINKII